MLIKKEIEIKIQLNDKKEIQQRLQALGWYIKDLIFHKTYLLSTPNEALFEQGIFPRVRVEGNRTIFTIKVKSQKNKADDKNLNYFQRDEYEVEVEDADKIVKMLSILGLTEQLVDEKYRQTWLNEKSEGLSIVIDTLPFGCFLEIEGTKDQIEKTVKQLDLQNEKRITIAYRRVYREYCKKNGIKEERNLIFNGNKYKINL